MPVISAGVVTKQGRIVLARQFSEISRIRVEGLLSAFPRLLESSSNKQVTFIDAGTVRYVYQPLDELFLVLVTTKHSNIVEDLATLHLMGRLIPEYVPDGIQEATLEANSFEIFFALDEVVVGGKRENTTVEQINTYLEMDSYEERMAIEEKKQQMMAAAKTAVEHAQQLRERKRAAAFGGSNANDPSYGGFGSSSTSPSGEGGFSAPQAFTQSSAAVPAYGPPSAAAPAPAAAPRVGMSLGKAKKTDLSAKVQREVGGGSASAARDDGSAAQQQQQQQQAQQQQAQQQALGAGGEHAHEGVHVMVEEKIVATLGREGETGQTDVKGELSVLVSDPRLDHIKLALAPMSNDFQFRAHAKVNKALFASDQVLCMLDGKPFPVQQPVTILRWRLQNAASVQPPITFTCWPESDSIMIEYELSNANAPPLEHLALVVPLYTTTVPSGVTPSTGSYEVIEHAPTGGYAVVWVVPVVSSEQHAEGNLEIRLGDAAQEAPQNVFFPIEVSFSSAVSIGMVRVHEVSSTETSTPVRFSQETRLVTENMTIS